VADSSSGQPAVGGQVLVVGDGCLEEIYDFGMVLVHGAVAGDIEGGVACPVFGEFMTPEIAVG
jgi:hypothetical protein